MSFESDLLDLCRLNLMEENIQNSCALDRDTTMSAIDVKKRYLVVRIKNEVEEQENREVDSP